jgi:hypothetical protein
MMEGDPRHLGGLSMSTAQAHPGAYKHFYKLALEYYVSGRAAVLCGNTRITGNLLHHAVEMLLKGHLSKTTPLKDLKSRQKFGHNLPKLWTAFKGLFPADDLTEFDTMIDELEKFEEIRYPDEILAHGVRIGLGFGRGKPITRTTPGRPEPVYQMGLGDVDAFFAQLFPLCRLNPRADFMFLSPGGREVLIEGNAESKNWLDPLP